MGESEIFEVLQGLLVDRGADGAANSWRYASCLGFAIGLMQALTSVQEMTLTFVPKIVAVVVVFFL